jgi:hypothetical protein
VAVRAVAYVGSNSIATVINVLARIFIVGILAARWPSEDARFSSP